MNTASQHTQFDILFHFEPLHPTEDPSRPSLFCSASIACNFPVPERQGEMGLGILIDIMAGIAGGSTRRRVHRCVPIERQGNRVRVYCKEGA